MKTHIGKTNSALVIVEQSFKSVVLESSHRVSAEGSVSLSLFVFVCLLHTFT